MFVVCSLFQEISGDTLSITGSLNCLKFQLTIPISADGPVISAMPTPTRYTVSALEEDAMDSRIKQVHEAMKISRPKAGAGLWRYVLGTMIGIDNFVLGATVDETDRKSVV